jgi:hypothetical protein
LLPKNHFTRAPQQTEKGQQSEQRIPIHVALGVRQGTAAYFSESVCFSAWRAVKSKSKPEKYRRGRMSYQPETPFDNIESALEYVNYLLDAIQEAHKQIETEIERSSDLKLARRKQALQLVSYKLDKLESHIATSRRILKDLRTLRRLLLEERGTAKPSPMK